MAPALPTGSAIGVDIGGTNVRAARVDAAGHVRERRRLPTDTTTGLAGLVIELCRELLDDEVAAIGIGIPGRLDAERRTVLSSGYVDLAGQPLAGTVAEAIGRPAVMENDAAMALFAELRVGAAAEAENVVLFTAGTGIGGAVAIGGRLRHGRANAGQLGHLALERGGPRCNCGRTGCAEMSASGTALGHLIEAAGLPPDTTIESLLARRDEQDAAAVLDAWGGAWRAAIDTVVAVLDPELVLIGGGLGASAVATLKVTHPTTSPWFECPVLPARLGDDAGVIGAGLLALEPAR